MDARDCVVAVLTAYTGYEPEPDVVRECVAKLPASMKALYLRDVSHGFVRMGFDPAVRVGTAKPKRPAIEDPHPERG